MTLWKTKETLEGGLRIDRWWWVTVKVGALVAASALVGIGKRWRSSEPA